MKYFSLCIALLFSSLYISAQDKELNSPPEINFSGFIDVFYAYDFNQPNNGFRQPFLYNHNRHNEFNLNMALLHINVNHDRYRANIGLQAGTYAQDNYAAEEPMLRSVYEANAGIALNSDGNLWLDVGIFPSHLGFESAISMDNYTLTRSFVAENSPYFLSGAKVSFDANDHWLFTATLTNGWQRIRRVQGNSMISLGTQVSYSPADNFTINWSTFYGTEDPDNTRRIMFFNNFYAVVNMAENLDLIAGIDFGSREQQINSADNDIWFAPTAIVHYKMNEKWDLGARFEYYNDENGVIIDPGTPNGFKTTGFSANLDYSPVQNVALRFEGRYLNSMDQVFENNGNLQNSNFCFMSSLSVKIN